MLVEKSHYLALHVCGNGDGDIAGEKPKGQRKADLKVWFGKLCFSAKDFAKPRFISVAAIKGQLVSNTVPGSYMLSEFCFYSSGLCHPISIWCQTSPIGLWVPPLLAPLAWIWGPGKVCACYS